MSEQRAAGITLEEAAENLGRGVVYVPRHGDREDGTITSVSGSYVFVLYRGDAAAKATRPDDLEWLKS